MRQNGFSIKYILTALVGLGMVLSQTAFAQSYQVKSLAGLPDGSYTKAYAINNAGEVAGEAGTGATDPNTNLEIYHAVVWNSNRVLTDLGTLGGNSSSAAAINSIGMVAGTSEDANGDLHGFLWMKGYGMVDLGTLPGGTTSFAMGINDGGEIVGFANDNNGDWHACHWYMYDADPTDPSVMPVLQMDDLGVLAGGTYSYAYGINNKGQIVGSATIAGGAYRAFLWDSTNGMQSLGTLTGGAYSFASGISDSGIVAGTADDVAGVPHAYGWNTTNGMVDMGTFATQSNDPGMACISPGGQFAGLLGSKAFLWKGGQMKNLSNYITAGAPTWTSISGINDRLEIAGYDATQSYVLTANVALSSVQCNPSTVVGGTAVSGKITLSAPAPAGGLVVMLSSDKAAAKVAASTTVPSGATTATFSIQTSAVKIDTAATITASYNGASQTASLTVKAPSLVSIQFGASNVKGGSLVQGTITINGPAPVGGIIVNITNNNAAANFPGAVVIQQGMRTATFTIKTKAVSKKTTVTFTAQQNSVSKTATLTVNP